MQLILFHTKYMKLGIGVMSRLFLMNTPSISQTWRAVNAAIDDGLPPHYLLEKHIDYGHIIHDNNR